MIRTRSGWVANTAAGTSSTTVGTIASKLRATSTNRATGYVSSVAFTSTSYLSRSFVSIAAGSRRTRNTLDRSAPCVTLGSSAALATDGHTLFALGRGGVHGRRDTGGARAGCQGAGEQQADDRHRNVLDERNQERHGDGGILVQACRRCRERVEQLEDADVSRRQTHDEAQVDDKERQQRVRGCGGERCSVRGVVERGPLPRPRDE